MTWETKDVLVMLVPLGAFLVAWGAFQARVAAVVSKLGELGTALEKTQSQLAAEIKELKRDLQASQRDQGRRLGELETASKISRELAKMVGQGTPAFGTLIANLQRPPASGGGSGQVQRPVADGGSSDEDDDHRR